jgi:hypothetical protein
MCGASGFVAKCLKSLAADAGADLTASASMQASMQASRTLRDFMMRTMAASI